MIPQNFSRYILLASSLAFVALASARPMRSDARAMHRTQGYTMTAHCSSELGGNVVYLSKIFDVIFPRRGSGLDTSRLNNAFRNYLVEEYDFKSNTPYAAGCRVFETLSQAEANKRQIISQAQQANKQIVEIKWNPGPIVGVEYGDGFLIGPKTPPPAHTFCAVGHDDTMYFSDVFDTFTQNYQTVANAFNSFLHQRYGFEPQVDATCTPLNTVREAAAVLKARIGGVRYNRRKAVETGWKYDPTDTYKPVPKATPKPDDDPEPAPSPSRPKAPPSQSINEFATKELPLVLDYCQKDPMLSKIFDCDRVQRSVYNYRMEHGMSEPLASLFKQEKVNLAGAIGTGLNLWVKHRANAQGFSNKVSNCIEQKVNVSFYEKPYISQLQKIYDASVAACKQ